MFFCSLASSICLQVVVSPVKIDQMGFINTRFTRMNSHNKLDVYLLIRRHVRSHISVGRYPFNMKRSDGQILIYTLYGIRLWEELRTQILKFHCNFSMDKHGIYKRVKVCSYYMYIAIVLHCCTAPCCREIMMLLHCNVA